MADDEKGDEGGLRVVPLHPDPWLSPQWLLTGEAVVAIWLDRYGNERFRYVEDVGWFEWRSHVWQLDHCCMVERSMAELCRGIGATKKKGVRTKVESAGFIVGCAKRPRAELAVDLDVFDQTLVLNCPTTCIELSGKTWTTRENRREDYCSKSTSVDPVAGPCPTWKAFLHEVTDGDLELIDYWQRLAGYWLTPFTTEQAMFFFHGSGGNGKGTFLRVLARLWGSYAATASLDLFLSTKYEQHPEELAALRGVRLVIATETEANRSWNESKVKALTGGDPVRARFMRQNSFEYQPQFKICISGNHEPTIKNPDAAWRRRLQVSPFTVEIPLGKQDGTLEDRLVKEEGPQILAWALEGFNLWRQNKLSPPKSVEASTKGYLGGQDLKLQWINQDMIRDDPNEFTSSTDIFASWKQWCATHGEREGSVKALSSELKKRQKEFGIQFAETNECNGFWGIKPKPRPYWDRD